MNKMKKLLTLEDLVRFCKEQKLNKFSSKDTGYQLSVQIPATFEVVDSAYQDNTLLFGKVKIFHIGPNRNGSSVTKEAAEKSLGTIAYKPLLANFCEIDGVKDFTSHDMEFNEDGTVTYIEHQIGCFTADPPVIQYDETTEKEFVFAKVAIPREYTDACEIIERKNGTKVSAELLINEMNYSAKDDILELTDIIVQGCTCLGTNPETGENIEEGMQGARLDIADFSTNKNSITIDVDAKFSKEMVEMLERIENAINTLSNFNNTTDSKEEGGENAMNKFEELLELYGLTAEEIEFEVEGLSDEDLEAAFTKALGDAEEFKKKKKCASEEDEDSDDEDFAGCGKKKKKCSNDDNDSEDEDEDFAGCGKKKKRCSVNAETGTIEFEMSHDDIRMALYSLLESSWDDNSYSWICEVYDNYFVYQKETYSDSGYESKYYKQSYSKSADNVELTGDAVEVFSTFVTESEKTALDMIRSQYDELKAFKDNYEAEQQKIQKDAIFDNEVYDDIRESDEFKALIKDAAKYSVDEIQNKCDLLFAANVKKMQFAAKDKKPHSLGFNFNKKEYKKTSAYGNLFKKD